MFFHPVVPNFSFEAKTLLIPVVSTANLPQLAVDILLATLSLHVVGVFDARYFIPAVGAQENGEECITTPFEIFGHEDIDVVLIQQRSPVLKSRKQDFVDELFGFIKASAFRAVLFVSGVGLSNRTDAQMMTPLYYFHPPNSPPITSEPLARLKQLSIPEFTSPVDQLPSSNEGPIPFIPGGGLTRRILTSLPTDWPIPTSAVLQFTLEGDNQADAQLLASAVAKILSLGPLIVEWRRPGSWKQGLFGAPHDQTLYG